MSEQRMTLEQLAEGRRLLAAASDWPWHARQYRDGEWTLRERGEDGRGSHIAGFALNREDAEVCAWLRNAAEALFDDADALAGARAEVARLRDVFAHRDEVGYPEAYKTGFGDAQYLIAERLRLRATVGRLHALLRRCEPYLGNYQCADQQEGDELGALEADIAAELGPEREGASE